MTLKNMKNMIIDYYSSSCQRLSYLVEILLSHF